MVTRPTYRVLVVAAAALGLFAGSAFAAGPATRAVAAKSARKPAPVTAAIVVPDAPPDQVKAAELVYYGSYDCEFKKTIQIVQSPKHSAYVDVTHGKSTWLMKPVLSSTGAVRLEDVRGETLMVQIAAKSMLLNVKVGQRIVDDCISPRQRELIEAAKAAKSAEQAAASAPADPASVPAVATPAVPGNARP
ncbi:MAG: hypothetical protein M3Z16_06875 [Pseudomonadota bacterium]|nr:hypothetical protein [Pseudomonadota bacterium]